MLRYDADDWSLIDLVAPFVWSVSFSVYTANTSMSSSRADEIMRVAISPLIPRD